MRRILSLQGGMAAGKTTLAKRLEKRLKDVTFVYENPYPIVEKRKKLNLDIYKEKDFIINQNYLSKRRLRDSINCRKEPSFLTAARKMLNFTRYTFQKRLVRIGMWKNS